MKYCTNEALDFAKKHRIINRDDLVATWKKSRNSNIVGLLPATFHPARVIFIDKTSYVLKWNDYITFGKLNGEQIPKDPMLIDLGNDYYTKKDTTKNESKGNERSK